MALHTTLCRLSSDCKTDLNMSPGLRKASAAVGKPRETTAKAEGAPSETMVTELPLSFPSLSFVTLRTTSSEGETEVSVFYLSSF